MAISTSVQRGRCWRHDAPVVNRCDARRTMVLGVSVNAGFASIFTDFTDANR